MSETMGAMDAPMPPPMSRQDEPVGSHAEAERLHPLSVAIGIITSVPRLIFAAVPISFAMRDQDALTISLVALVFLLILAISGFLVWLRWSRFTFLLDSQEIRVTSGILSRNSRSIPYQRIQDVNIEQNLLARILGLAKVKLETGSGGGEDASLDAVTLARADALRDTIRERKADSTAARTDAISADGASAAPADSVASESEAITIFTMDGRRLFILGIFSFSLAIFAFLFALLQNFDFLIPDEVLNPENIIDAVTDSDVGGEIDRLRNVGGVIGQVFAALAGLTGLLFVGFVTGLITVVLREYGFRLDQTDNAFRRRRGLLTLTDVAMPIHRVQAALVITGPVRRRFGWKALKFQSLASDGDEGSDHMVAPLARQHEVADIAARADIDIALEDDALNRVAHSYWLIPVIPAMLLLVIAVSIVSAIQAGPDLLLLILLAPLIALIGWLRWKHHLYASTDRFLHVRSGFWRQGHTILPLRKIQSVDVSQNIIERAFDKASVTIGVAGGSVVFPLTVHALATETAYAMRAYLLEKMTQMAAQNGDNAVSVAPEPRD
ncbi:MAG: PH domain-containing protein [Pseudomonadota bacterium]